MFSAHAGHPATGVPSSPPTVTRTLLVDDHPIVLSGLEALVRDTLGYEVVGATTSPAEAFEIAEAEAPALAVVDLFLGTRDGLELVRRLRARLPELRVLVVSAHDEHVYAGRALSAGAHGFVSKRATPPDLASAVRAVACGEIALADSVRERLVEQFLGHDGTPDEPTARLTDRELEAFRLFGLGLATAQVAEAMSVSTKTVETYRLSIKSKLGLESNNAFIYRAVLWTLGHDPRPSGATAVS